MVTGSFHDPSDRNIQRWEIAIVGIDSDEAAEGTGYKSIDGDLHLDFAAIAESGMLGGQI